MKTILIVTVGGAHQPILRSIEQNCPDAVYFLCSDDAGRTQGSWRQVVGEGKVLKSRPELSGPDQPNIQTQAGLAGDQVQVVRIRHFDSLNDCYLAAKQTIEQVRREHGECRIIADYTGGTKSMTAGLVAAALDDGRCEIGLVTGLRADLQRVVDGTESVRPVRVWDVQAERRLQVARQFLARYDYAAAAHVVEEAMQRFASEETADRLARWLALCRGFDAWDRFDHHAAQKILRPIRGVVDEHKRFLSIMLEGRGHGFELVEDLLRNAERRAAQSRWDDAMGRLYRALEMTAQCWLRLRHNIDTGSVHPASLPEAVREDVTRRSTVDKQGQMKIGCRDAWKAIAGFAEDPLGELYRQREHRLLDFLNIRNASLFAHGQKPITNEQYRNQGQEAVAFIEQCVARAAETLGKRRPTGLPQFPTQWD